MRILIVANDPRDLGGVANYTRPLAEAFARMGHEVHYLFSGSWNRAYNWRLKPYLRRPQTAFSFVIHELVNAPNWPFQFGAPLVDIHAPEADPVLRTFLEGLKPDVMHVHSRLGLPGSLFSLAHGMGIPMFCTHHVYGMICQRRVMIEADGSVCPGPTSMEKCARCTGTLPISSLKTLARIQNTSPSLARGLTALRRKVLSALRPARPASALPPDGHLSQITAELEQRKTFMLEVMNEKVRTNLCVSQDVKATLARFGVRKDQLVVQHIGSVFGERQIRRERVPSQPLVIGNIGGVNHYKGTHVLLRAASRLMALGLPFRLEIHGWFDPAYVEKLLEECPRLPVQFSGRYTPEQLPALLDGLDVVVLPSICQDTAPQTIFESFSRGVPIVASDIGGFPDFVEDNVNGRLFQAGSEDALAAVLEAILRDPSCLARYATQVPRLKPISENAQELLVLYEEAHAEITKAGGRP